MTTSPKPTGLTVTSVRRRGIEEIQFMLIDSELKNYRVTLDSSGNWSTLTMSDHVPDILTQAALISAAMGDLISRIKAVIP